MKETGCSHCGKVILRKKNRTAGHSRHFCSGECRKLALRNGKTVKCDWCSASFYKPLSRLRNENFCCAACRNRWLSKQNVEIRNVPGHTKGHKAPHLTELNRRRNPLGSIAGEQRSQRVPSRVYRAIVEGVIGRKLRHGEDVHHLNGDRTDNRPQNLAALPHREHHRLHMHLACAKHEIIRENGGDESCQKTKPDPEA